MTVARDLGGILSKFVGSANEPDLSMWKKLVRQDKAAYKKTVTIGLVAKYVDNTDTYISVVEALKAAAWSQRSDVSIKWINAETVRDEDFTNIDGILVPGGFGERGVEGKIAAATFALERNMPYLGICLGLQVACIAAARRAGLVGANSEEFADTLDNVVYIMDGQEGKQSTGGTLRLGNYPAVFTPDSLAQKTYGAAEVTERHRHRYEVNQAYKDDFARGGLVISGTSPDGTLVEYVESPHNDYFIATQAHPEFKSRPMRPHPLFVGLISAALKRQR